MFGRLKQMVVKEFLQMFRDVRMRVVIFVVPLIQMTVLSFALTTDVRQIRTGVLDLDRSPSSREFIQEFSSSGHFNIKMHARSQADMARLLDRSRVRVILHIPPGFEGDLQSGRTAPVQLLADGTDSNTTSIVFGYAEQIVTAFSERVQAERLVRLRGPGHAFGHMEPDIRAWYNPNLESRLYYVPALIAMLVFNIHIKGNGVLLYVMTGVYLSGNVGLALLISVSADTQQQALLTAFLILMPCVLLSGFIFPIRNMPPAVQYATLLNPMRWYLEILRGVLIKGVGIRALWAPILGQGILACIFLALA